MRILFNMLILLSVGLCLSLYAKAETPVIALSELSNDTALFLGKRVTVWENTAALVDPEAMLAGSHDADFVPSRKEFPGPGYIKGELWLRIVIRNSGSEPQSMALESRYALTDFISFHYKAKDGTPIAIHHGDRSLMPHEPSAFRSPLFEFVAQPGDNVYYLRTESKGPNILSLYLWTADGFKGHRFIDTLFLGALFGFLIALFIYNSFLAVSFWSRTYTYYSIFLLAMILLQNSMQNMWPYLLPPSAASWLSNEGYMWIGGVTNFIALLTTTAFLYMKRNLPRFLRVFYGLMVLCPLPMLAGLFASFDTQARLLSLVLAVNTIAMITASIMAMLQGYRPAAYYLLASLAFMAANILLALNTLGVYHVPHVIQYGNFAGVVIEGLLMSLAIGDRVHFIRNKADQVIRQLNQELQNHLTQVEAQVAERTETIRTILDNVASGFLIVDPAGKVASGISQSCHQLLGQTLREGQVFADLLQLPEPSQKLWRLAWDQLFQDLLPTDVALAQLPAAIALHGRSLRLEAKALRDAEGRIKHMLFTIQDVTELRRKQRESRRNRTLIRILQDLEAFRQFINHSFEFVSRLKVSKDPREQAFLLHTLKGNSRVFGLKAIARFLHQLEGVRNLSKDDIQGIERLFLEFLSAHDTILKTPWGNSAQEPRVTRLQLHALEQLIEKTRDAALKRDVDDWIRDALARPVSALVQPMVENGRKLARRLQKPIHIEVHGGDVRLRSREEEKAIEFLVHVVRNAVVHGIESDRASLGKPAEGRIDLEFHETLESLVVICRDDGQGFDRKIWEEQARSQKEGRHPNPSALPLVELVEWVSQGDFSTQQVVTMDAGRGVGLGGIIRTIRALGGRIQLDSDPGQGSRVLIEMQRQVPIRRDAAS